MRNLAHKWLIPKHPNCQRVVYDQTDRDRSRVQATSLAYAPRVYLWVDLIYSYVCITIVSAPTVSKLPRFQESNTVGL